MLLQAKLFCFCVAVGVAVAAGVVSVVDVVAGLIFSVFVKWCLHYGINRSKLGPFLSVENIFLCFKRH